MKNLEIHVSGNNAEVGTCYYNPVVRTFKEKFY